VADVFDFDVDAGSNGSKTFSVLKASFGDGYTQRAKNGINSSSRKWNITIADKYAYELEPIKAFLDDRAGAVSFLWTPPNGVQGKFVCEAYTETPAVAGLSTLTAVFEEDFSA
jgi:phage-related protein